MSKETVKNLRSQLKFYMKSTTTIKDITPSSGENFEKPEDKWVKLPALPSGEKLISMVYYGKKNFKLIEHKHSNSSEQITILNPNGKIRILTPFEDTIISYPNSFLIKKDVPHIIYFLSDTNVLFIWNPPLSTTL